MEEYLENPKTDEEFYSLIESKRKDIESLPISDGEKEKLYSLVEMNIQDYESLKASDLKKDFEKVAEFFGESENAFVEIRKQTEENNRTLHFAKINSQIASYKLKKTQEQINNSIKREKGKLEAKVVRQLIWNRMVEANRDNQNN